MTDESRQDPRATRRCVLLGAGVLGMAGGLSACSPAAVPYDANDEGQAPGPDVPTSAASGTAAGGGAANGSTGNSGQMGTLLGMASDIPGGGGGGYTVA